MPLSHPHLVHAYHSELSICTALTVAVSYAGDSRSNSGDKLAEFGVFTLHILVDRQPRSCHKVDRGGTLILDSTEHGNQHVIKDVIVAVSVNANGTR